MEPLINNITINVSGNQYSTIVKRVDGKILTELSNTDMLYILEPKIKAFFNEYGNLFIGNEPIEFDVRAGELVIHRKRKHQVTIEVTTMVTIEVDELEDAEDFISNCAYSFPSNDTCDVVETEIIADTIISHSEV